MLKFTSGQGEIQAITIKVDPGCEGDTRLAISVRAGKEVFRKFWSESALQVFQGSRLKQAAVCSLKASLRSTVLSVLERLKTRTVFQALPFSFCLGRI